MKQEQKIATAFYLAFALQSTGQAIIWQFITHFLKHDLGASSFLSLTYAWVIPAFMTMIAVNFWGWFSDGMRTRKPFMLIGFFGYTATFFLTSIVSTYNEYILVTFFGAFFSAAALPIGQAYLTTNTAKKGERLGFFLAAQSAGWFFGALVSGLLYEPIGMFSLYQIATVVGISAFAICFFLVRDLPPADTLGKPRVTFREVIQRPGMGRMTFAAGLSSIGMNSISFMLAIMMVDELGGDPSLVGYANSVATMLAVIFTGYIGRIVDRRGPVRILVAAYSSYIIFAFGFAIVTEPITAAIMWALPIYPLSSTAAYAFASMSSGEEERGRAMGLVNGAQNAGSAIGPIVGGLAAEFIFRAVQPLSWLNLGFNLLALIIALSLIPVGRTLRGRSSHLDEDTLPIPRL